MGADKAVGSVKVEATVLEERPSAIYLVVLEHQGFAYLLLGAGAVCLLSGITCGTFAQSRVRATSR